MKEITFASTAPCAGGWGGEVGERGGVDCLGIWKLSGFYMIRYTHTHTKKSMEVMYSLFIPELINCNLLCFDPI